MISLLLALAAGATGEPATLQSCVMTPSGWVCQYKIPSVTVTETGPDGAPVSRFMPPTPPAPALPPVAADPEAARQARLIANCADASWMSLCLPRDRREARRLRDAAIAGAMLRSEVTQLLSKGKCDEAVSSALAGGDLPLAREARDFCAAPGAGTVK